MDNITENLLEQHFNLPDYLYNIYLAEQAAKDKGFLELKLRYEYIEDIIRHHHSRKIAELGSGECLPALYLLWQCRYIIYEYVAVDPGPPSNIRFPYDLFHSYPGTQYLQTTALKAARIFDDGYFDLVFMDELAHITDFIAQFPHSPPITEDSIRKHIEVLKADIQAWIPKVKKGGILCGHDYDSVSHPYVKKAVNEVFPNGVHVLLENHSYGNNVKKSNYFWWIGL